MPPLAVWNIHQPAGIRSWRPIIERIGHIGDRTTVSYLRYWFFFLRFWFFTRSSFVSWISYIEPLDLFVLPNRLHTSLVKSFPIPVLAHPSMNRSTLHVCLAYVPFPESWRPDGLVRYEFEFIFFFHLNSICDNSNNSIFDWWLDGGRLLCLESGRTTGKVFEDERELEKLSRRSVRMIVLIFLCSIKRTPLPSCKVPRTRQSLATIKPLRPWAMLWSSEPRWYSDSGNVYAMTF